MRVRFAALLLFSVALAQAAPKINFPKIKPANSNPKAIHAIALSPDVPRIAIGHFGKVRIADDLRPLPVPALFAPTILSGPAGKVNALAFSPDGKFLFAAGGNAGTPGEVKIWRNLNHKLIHTLTGHRDAIYSLAISPDGLRIATGSYDQQIILWNAKDGKLIRTLKGHNGAIFGLAFRRDGRVLASASADATVKLWQVKTGRRLDTLSQPLKAQHAVAFSPDGKTLIAGGADNRIRAWSISATAAEGTNRLRQSRFAHEGAILQLAWSPDGKTLLSTANNQTAKLWHAEGIRPLRDLGKLTDWPTAAALSDQRAYVGQLDGTLKKFPIQK